MTNFCGHFIFGRNLPHQPKSWESEEFSQSTLTYHSSSEFIPVYHNNTRVGYILGDVLDIQEILQYRTLELDSDDFSAFENSFYSLAGRIVGYVKLHDQERFYLDPSGGMPAVYSLDSRLIASVPTLILNNEPGNTPPNYLMS